MAHTALAQKKKKNKKKISHRLMSVAGELIHFCGTLNLRGLLDPIKPAYDRRRPDVRRSQQPSHLTDQISMPAVLVTGPNVTQNSLFLPQRWPKSSPVLIVPTHKGMERLSWPGWLVTYRNGMPRQKTVTHSSTNRARLRVTSLAHPITPLPLRQAAQSRGKTSICKGATRAITFQPMSHGHSGF